MTTLISQLPGQTPRVNIRQIRSSRRGVTLVEVVVVVTILGIFVSMSVPCYRRAIEQTRLDVAAAQLRTIWAAQRMYFLEHRSYATDFTMLASNELLDTAPLASDPWYSYTISSDGSNFIAYASRSGSAVYSGALSIGPEGVVSGNVSHANAIPLSPGFQ